MLRFKDETVRKQKLQKVEKLEREGKCIQYETSYLVTSRKTVKLFIKFLNAHQARKDMILRTDFEFFELVVSRIQRKYGLQCLKLGKSAYRITVTCVFCV